MRLKHISFFMVHQSQYEVLHHFTRELTKAFQKLKVKTDLYDFSNIKRESPISILKKSPPQCTCTFNAIDVLTENPPTFFCDVLEIPHFSFLVDSPQAFYFLLHSRYTIPSFVDRKAAEFFSSLGAKHVLFIPHAVEESLIADYKVKKEYDVTMLSSFIDYEAIGKNWKNKYPPEAQKILWDAVDYAMEHPNIPYYTVLATILEKYEGGADIQTKRSLVFADLTYELEFYCRGWDRIKTVQSIKDVPVHVFGSFSGGKNMKRYFKNQKNIVFHDPVSFEEAIEVMKRSKILLNSSSWIKDGAHERLFYGLACGALPITNTNPFLKESFKDEDSILLNSPHDWKSLNEKVSTYARDDHARNAIVKKGQEVVKSSHTWKCRARELMEKLPPILRSLES